MAGSLPDPPLSSRESESTAVRPPEEQDTVIRDPGERHQRSLASGARLGPYLVHRLLGAGGMGEVYECEEIDSGRRVAVKTLSRAELTTTARARFLREGRLAAALSHPNTVYIFGSEEIGGVPIIAMELVSGGTLADRIRARGPMPVKEAVEATLQIIAGLDAASTVGILHRDVKPSNCFIDSDGTVKVGDFGLSVSTERTNETQLTLAHTLVGTPAFASPEQLRADDLDVRSDIYSVGATLYFLLTGHAPFEEQNLLKLITQVATEPPKPPQAWQPTVPEPLAAVVMQCLAKSRDDRPPDYDSLRTALVPFVTPDEPAPLVLRSIAYVIDSLVVSLLQFGVFPLVKYADPAVLTTLGSSPLSFASLTIDGVATLIYFGTLEGRFGTTAGKILLGLRVVRHAGGLPGWRRGFARAALFVTAGTIAGLMVLLFSAGIDRWSIGLSGVLAAMAPFLLFVGARRRSGFQGWHDRLTETRVVRTIRAAQKVDAVAPVATDRGPTAIGAEMIGPYIVSRDGLEPADGFAAGYDPRLRRLVWLRRSIVGAAAVSPSRRDLARYTRLRWVSGRRGASPHDNWDAYEAIDGTPLRAVLAQNANWAAMRHWLYDLATEMEAAAHDGTTVRYQPENVWVSRDGHAKVLDSEAVSDPPAGVATENALISIAAAARLTPLPLHARELVDQIVARRFSAAEIVAGLRGHLSTPAAISRARRFTMIAVCASMPLVLSVMFLASALFIHRMQVATGLDALIRHHDLLHLLENAGRTAEQRAVELVIAGRFRSLPTDEMLNVSIARTRAHWQRILDATPAPSAEALREAEAQIAPLIAEPERFGLPPAASFWTFMLGAAGVWWVLAAIVGMLCAFVLRGGLTLRLAEAGLVIADGTPASRWRAMARAGVAWSPVLVAVIAVIFHETFAASPNPNPLLWSVLALLGLVFVAGAVKSVLSPSRGWQDRIAGTYLVPR